MSGKLLAHYLASENPAFTGQSISIIGFSLGCQVTISLINRLEKLGRNDLIHNVYLLAGATYINEKNNKQQRKRIQATVAGRVANVLSKSDSSLITYNIMVAENCLGRNAYYVNTACNSASTAQSVKKFRFDNYDVTQFIHGHMDYRPKLDLVMEFIKFDS